MMRIPQTHRRVPRPIPGFAILMFAILGTGCSSSEKEKEPVVSVQVEPAQKGPIEQIVSAEAVVYPFQQAVITPKITSTIKEFRVHRGSRVHKGQLLAILENADLSATAEQSKGEFEQAEASYTTTTVASLPQEIQKASSTRPPPRLPSTHSKKSMTAAKSSSNRARFPRRDFDAAEVALAQARTQSEVTQRQLEDLRRVGRTQTLKSAQGQLTAAKGKYLGLQRN